MPIYKLNRRNGNIKLPKLKNHEMIFTVALVIYLFFSMLSTSFYYINFYSAYKYILLFCIGLLAFKEIYVGKISRYAIFAIPILVFIIAVVFMMDIKELVMLFLFFYSARDVRFDKILPFIILISVFSLVFVIVSAELGIITNYVSTNYETGRMRHYLGFTYSVIPAAYLTNIIMLVLYRKQKKISYIGLLILTAVSYIMYTQSTSRVAFYSCCILLLIALLYRLRSSIFEKSKAMHFFLAFSFIIFGIISFVFTILYNESTPWKASLNRLLENRLRIGQIALIRYGLKLFPQDVPWVGNALDMYGKKAEGIYFTVDNGYIEVGIWLGIIFLMLLLILLTLGTTMSLKANNYYLAILLFFVALNFLIQDNVLYLYYNSFWLAISPIIFDMVRSKSGRLKYKTRMSVKPIRER